MLSPVQVSFGLVLQPAQTHNINPPNTVEMQCLEDLAEAVSKIHPNRRVLSFLRPRLGFLLEWWEWPLSKSQNSQPSTSVNGFNDCLVETCWNRDKQNGQNKRDRSWRSFLRAASCDLMVHHSTTAVATHVSCLLNKVSIHIFIIFTWPNSVEFQLNSGGERSQPSARHSAWRCAGITWTALGCFGISTPRFQNRRTCAIEQRRTAMKNYEQNQQHGQRPMRSLHLCVSLAVLPLTLDAWLESFMLSARTIQAS